MRLGHLAAAFCLAFALLRPSAALADESDYLGRTVTAVTIRIESGVVADSRLLTLVDAVVGKPLTMRDVRESLMHLFSLGLYEDVRVHATAVDNGVALAFELIPLRPVTIEFRGSAPGVKEGRLRQMLVERFGQSPRATRAPEIAQAVEQALREAGYLRARVTPSIEAPKSAGPSTLRLIMEPGVRATIGTVSVEGDAGVPVPELLATLELKTGAPFLRDDLNARVERFLAERRRRGYYQARLLVNQKGSADDLSVNLVLNAELGPIVRVVFAGDPVPADRRDDLAPVAREGSADEDLLEDSSRRIEDFFRAQGYRDAAAPHTREENGGELIVTFTVRKGGQYRIEAIDLTGNASITTDELMSHMRIRAGQPFAGAVLAADLTQIEEAYRRKGFASAKADATTQVQPPAPDQHVPIAIRISIAEGVQTLVDGVQIEGNQSVPDADLRSVLHLVPGAPFSIAQLALDRDAVELKYANLGYQSVSVESRPGLSADSRRADVTITVREGPRTFVDHVLIVGNARTKTETIERELQVKSGDPLGLEAISESQRRLAALGLFRRARITQLGRPEDTRRDVLVSVEEAPLTTVGYGGGFEVRSLLVRAADNPDVASEKLEFAPRASFEIGRRNLFGTNRSVNLFTSASLHPKDDGQPVTTDNGAYGFPEYRVLGLFREPRLHGTKIDFRVTGTFEQQIRSSFDFSRRSAAADLSLRVSRRVTVSGGYQIQRTRVFNNQVDPEDQLTVDRLFPKVRISSFVASVTRDTRDDPVDPSGGSYFGANGQLAARAIGSEVGFLKSFFTAQTFHTLPGRRGVVFAGSARLGAAIGFPGPAGSNDLPVSERFFAGGDTTVRGFSLDQLGVQHTPASASDTLDAAGFPLGGNALLIFNGELRVPIKGGVKIVGFTDVGNVFKDVSEMTASELRPAVGVGFRYKSPVGPLRLDIGFPLPRHAGESRAEWYITFGEAF